MVIQQERDRPKARGIERKRKTSMEEGDEKVSGEMQADHRQSTGTRTGNMSGFRAQLTAAFICESTLAAPC